MNTILHALIDLVYPRLCAVCDRWTGRGGLTLCWECRARLRWITPPFCRLCGDPVEGMATHFFECAPCRRVRPAFDRARSLLQYADVGGELVRRFKYRHACWAASEMTQWLEQGARLHFSLNYIDCVMAVPLSARKQRERTYNQARLLAAGLASKLRIPYGDGLIRRRYTVSQTRLNTMDRRRNVRGAFAVRIPEWVRGRRILLIDDVMTTGATLDECARILRQSGASGVYALTVARGQR